MENIKFKKLGDGYILVNYNTFQRLNPIVFDDISDFYDGFASVRLRGKGWNFINKQGELLWKGDKWFSYDNYFTDGFVRVKIEGKGWNLIDTNGELVWKGDIWFA